MVRKLFLTIIGLMLVTSMAFAQWTSATILNAVATTVASTDYDVQNYRDKTFYIVASGVTTGGTVQIETSPNGTNWAVLQSVSVTANGVTEVAVTGMFHRYIRANLSARTDGTYTVMMFLRQ